MMLRAQALLVSDFGPRISFRIVDTLRDQIKDGKLKSGAEIKVVDSRPLVTVEQHCVWLHGHLIFLLFFITAGVAEKMHPRPADKQGQQHRAEARLQVLPSLLNWLVCLVSEVLGGLSVLGRFLQETGRYHDCGSEWRWKDDFAR